MANLSVTLTPVGVQSPWFSGLRKVRLHDLRHGRASLLLASGTDMALVSKMLGHSSITLTADTYAHLLTGVGRRAADAADALIPRTPRDQSVTTSTPETRKALLDHDRGGLPAGALVRHEGLEPPTR
ncbi:MAG: tyrosine-type recombinase/integrase [Nocardioides sp.]